jgi:hypothetical protein
MRMSMRAGRRQATGGLVLAAALFAAAIVQAEEITVVGTINSDGVECTAMTGDDGTLYTLTPRDAIGLTQPGTRIKVTGTVAEVSMCQQGTTIEVAKVEPAE